MLDMSRHGLPVADRLLIRELVDRYTDIINHREWAALTGLFTPDAVWETAGPTSLRFEGAPKIAGAIRWNVSRQVALVQIGSGVVIDPSGLDRASVRSTMLELGRAREDGPGMQTAGTFHDHVIKQLDGVWRFAHRVFRVRYTDSLPSQGEIQENRAS